MKWAKKEIDRYSDSFGRNRTKLGGEIRAKKSSLTLNLRTNGLNVTSEPPPMPLHSLSVRKDLMVLTSPVLFDQSINARAEQLARRGSLRGHPSKQQPRSTLLDSVVSRKPSYPLLCAIGLSMVR
ncbi:hypothetical protein J6590_045857 [Homalodisca vitripennis]|nr:hypothetical protein J6590_045857 [Homalodisca vitripennis]